MALEKKQYETLKEKKRYGGETKAAGGKEEGTINKA